MVRRAVPGLIVVALALAACSRGQSGTISLATTPANLTGATTIASTVRVATPSVPAKASPSTPPAKASATLADDWYTSAAANAKYYYCAADGVDIAAANRRSYPTEAALLAEWAGKRSKWPQSKC